MKNFFVNEFVKENEKLVAACDLELAGKTLEEKTICINIRKDFYCGKKCSEKELIDIINSSTILNLIGNKCVQIAIDNGLVKKENVLNVCGVMHAQAVVMR